MREQRHAFADESHRRDDYLICAATVGVADLAMARKQLRGLRLRGQRRLHFADESDRRRRTILDELASLRMTTTIYVAQHRSQIKARNSVLRAMVAELRDSGVSRLILDAREGQDHRDRSTIHQIVGSRPEPAFEYLHQPSATEPILWVPDAIAWAWGRGGNWRKRVETLDLVAEVTQVQAI